MARLGPGPVGKKIEQIVQKNHRGAFFISRGDETPSYTIVAEINGQSHYFHYPGSNDFHSPNDLAWQTIEDSGFFVFGYPPLMRKWHEDKNVLGNTFRRIKSLGVRTYLDMHGGMGEDNAKWQRILRKAIPYIDVFNPNVEEALFIIDPELLAKLREKETFEKKQGNLAFDVIDAMKKPRDCLRQSADYFLNMGGHAILIKCGKHGLYLKTNSENPPGWQNKEFFVPAYIPGEGIKIDTTGAGDSVLAAVVAGDALGYDPFKCLELGVAAGLRTVEYIGSFGAYRSLGDLVIQDRKRIKPIF
jgi:sugar/nucleoside kinase (ribokinase family)